MAGPISQEPTANVRELDLTDEPVPTSGVEPPKEVPVQIQRIRENARGRLAMGLLLVIAGVIAGAFATIAWDWTTQQLLKDMMTAILNPLVGLFGAVIGFYFGTIGRDDGVESQPKSGTRT